MRAKHCTTDIPPVHVSVHTYCDDALVSANGRLKLERELFAFVRDRIPPIGPHIRYHSDSFPPALYELGIDSVTVFRYPGLKKAFWSLPYGAFVPESSAKLIQEVIDKKNVLVPTYRAKATELWLLILSGTDGLHSLVHLDSDILSATYSAGFDRVFLFKTFGPSVHELKLEAVKRKTTGNGLNGLT